MPQTQIVKSSELSWLNITNASKNEIDYLRKKFKFTESDLTDSYAHKHAQRPKIIIRPNYIFIVILFPIYNHKKREIDPAEIDIFVTKDHLITIHYNQLRPMGEFFDACVKHSATRNTYLNDSPAILLNEILERLYKHLYPMLDHISLDINNIERNIFAAKEREMVTEILVVKRNIVYFRKIIQIHRMILNKIVTTKIPFFNNDESTNVFYTNLIDQVTNIWEITENYLQTIDALEDTNSSMVTFKLNDIMRTLTIFSVIVFPLTLMAAVFGMNVVHMPFSGSEYDFWKIVGLMAIASFCMYLYFRHKKWI